MQVLAAAPPLWSGATLLLAVKELHFAELTSQPWQHRNCPPGNVSWQNLHAVWNAQRPCSARAAPGQPAAAARCSCTALASISRTS